MPCLTRKSRAREGKVVWKECCDERSGFIEGTMISVKGILNDGFETFERWKYRGRNDNLSATHLMGLEFIYLNIIA